MKNVALVDVICREVTEWMTDYMTPGVMAPEERARFELHLHACTWCMTYFKQMLRTAQSARLCVDPDLAREAPGASEAQLLAHFRSWSAKRAEGVPNAIPPVASVLARSSAKDEAPPGAGIRTDRRRAATRRCAAASSSFSIAVRAAPFPASSGPSR